MDRIPFRWWLLSTVAALVLSSVGWAVLQARHAVSLGDPVRARRQGRPIPVRTDRVKQDPVDQVTGATVTTEASQTSDTLVAASHVYMAHVLSTFVIEDVLVTEGAPVTKGQELFRLQNPVYVQAMKQEQSNLADAKAQLELAEQQLIANRTVRAANLAIATSDLEYRTKDLGFKQKLLDATERLYAQRLFYTFDLYKARSAFAQARFDLAQAEQNLQLVNVTFEVGPLHDREAVAKAAATLETAKSGILVSQRDLDRTKIVSTIDGVAGKVNVVRGDVALTNTVLVQILKLDPIHVRMDLPQERIDDVRAGQRAEIVLDSFPKETFTGTVTRITAQVDPTARVLSVIIQVDNPGNRIKAGISGFARLRNHRAALSVPGTAVIDDGRRTMVFRVEQGRARIREIRTGRTLPDGLVEVREGLAPGDEVVVFSNFYKSLAGLVDNKGFLLDDDPVDVNWRKWSQRE